MQKQYYVVFRCTLVDDRSVTSPGSSHMSCVPSHLFKHTTFLNTCLPYLSGVTYRLSQATPSLHSLLPFFPSLPIEYRSRGSLIYKWRMLVYGCGWIEECHPVPCTCEILLHLSLYFPSSFNFTCPSTSLIHTSILSSFLSPSFYSPSSSLPSLLPSFFTYSNTCLPHTLCSMSCPLFQFSPSTFLVCLTSCLLFFIFFILSALLFSPLFNPSFLPVHSSILTFHPFSISHFLNSSSNNFIFPSFCFLIFTCL